MNQPIPAAIHVKRPADVAFHTFTERIGAWWPRVMHSGANALSRYLELVTPLWSHSSSRRLTRRTPMGEPRQARRGQPMGERPRRSLDTPAWPQRNRASSLRQPMSGHLAVVSRRRIFLLTTHFHAPLEI
jgi:hypothetical protein